MLTVATPADLLGLVDADLGSTEPTNLTEARLADFAEATGTDLTEYLGLSLVNHFLPQLIEVTTFSMGVNVGLDGVRFGPAVAASDRLVGSGRVLSVVEIGEGIQSVVEVTVTAVGSGEPACVAATVSRYFP